MFLLDHFFPRMVWSKLKLAFSKFKMGITKIFILGKEYEMGGKIRLKSDKIKNILTWLISQDQIAVRAFLSTVQLTKCCVLGFTKLMHLLTCLTRKTEWRQTGLKELTFQILRCVYATKATIFRLDLALPVNLYSDISNFETTCSIIQIQDRETRLFIYNLFTLLSAKRNYNTYHTSWLLLLSL